jgi:uncharacterized protein
MQFSHRLAPLAAGLILALPGSAAASTGAGSAAASTGTTPAAAAAGSTTLHVVGHGRTFVTPDLATVTITVDRTTASRELARGRTNGATAQIISGLLRIGIARIDIQTSSITLTASSVSTGRHPHRTVYTAEIDLTVTTNRISLLSALFNVASRGGASGFSGPNFGFSDPSAGLIDATAAALKDARRRADAAAAAIGMQVIGVQSIDLDPGSTPVPAAGAPSAPTSTGSKTPVLPGRLEVDVSVDVVYLIG